MIKVMTLFWRNGEFSFFLNVTWNPLFSEISTAPLFFSLSTPYFSKITVFSWGPVLLQILSVGSMIEWKCEIIERFQKGYDRSVGVTKRLPSTKKNYQKSGIRSKHSSFCIIAGNNKMKVEINKGVNCSITLLVTSELKVINSTLINLHLFDFIFMNHKPILCHSKHASLNGESNRR